MEIGSKGTVWPSEWKSYHDPVTGVPVRQLTQYKTHSHHLYFTENGWYENNNRLLLISDRGNQANLYSMDMSTGEMTQLTDLRSPTDDLSACLNPEETKAYFKNQNQVVELDLRTLQERFLYECPEGFHTGQLSCTADGKYIVTAISENLSQRIRIDLGNGYVGHREVMEAGPLCQIIKISVTEAAAEAVHQDRSWIGHINASPALPHLITFCHEGPWNLVDHRIWGCDLRNGATWKIRERTQPLEKVGHEYWLADGENLGYHGFREDGTGFWGRIKHDNTEMEEVEFSFRNWHAHSDDFSQVIVDGRSPLTLMIYWKRVNGVLSAPKVLCEHRCSFHSQKVHAHPRFSPDGRRLLFTSDMNGYGNLYLVDIPVDVDQLPNYEG
ncbi:oligogalacturonate lyase family protein [Paenibacillus alginolyticus]|uniref:Oligogalacturonate lyase family protein n=1 Tax=Paenibacillus alginolyticus TaxID=59839 RepID=A0ABT4G8H8_9BACL|nr:oligogalacturonate lyase family protein [Paenibacillus alginolyticus]MCY9668097.1 oligogalacturonate lyase family protein [Paenibacillus alginolyticus]MCY9692480.1 oligogalacturonate lyase family protein [Paenibacillus alginolyticus]MEC0144272.1 oligogalacturonate lyase family protein [Paenibacillus alginolyticus]